MRCLILISLLVSAPVFAQSEPDAGTQASAADEACIPASETSQAPSDESGPSQEDGVEDSVPNTDACEEPLERPETPVETVVESGVESGPQDSVEENFNDQDVEFEPDEQISEDYPVPLPSDI